MCDQLSETGKSYGRNLSGDRCAGGWRDRCAGGMDLCEQTQRLAAVDQGCFCVPDQLFGTAYTIMAYHNDVGINEVFTEVYRMAMGAEPGGLNTLEVFYSLGLAAGIIVFFNHVGGRRLTKDPTPVEVSIKNYETDVDKTLIEQAGREGKELES